MQNLKVFNVLFFVGKMFIFFCSFEALSILNGIPGGPVAQSLEGVTPGFDSRYGCPLSLVGSVSV